MFVADDTNGVVFANHAAANLYGTAAVGSIGGSLPRRPHHLKPSW
ncbi:MAG: PAS domain-containing protein [Alphaproteobacteria bacterium]